MAQAATDNSTSQHRWPKSCARCWPATGLKLTLTGRLLEENVRALQAANLFNVMTPQPWNGYGAPLSAAIRTFAELGNGCGSTGSVAVIMNRINWRASWLPGAGQEEIFTDTRRAPFGGWNSIATDSKLRPVIFEWVPC